MADMDTREDPTTRQENAGASREKPRRNWSGIVAAILVLALAGWMASGMLMEEEAVVQAPQRASEPQPMTVEIRNSDAQTVTRFLNSEGEVRPDFSTPVRAEAAGVVESLAAPKGVRIEEGDPIATIAPAEREAQLAQARAELRRAQRDLDAVERLAEEGFSTTSRLEQARASVAAAEAQVASATEAVRNTTIRAPASGILNELMIDRGEVVAAGEEVARIVNTNPLVIEIRVPQRSVDQVETGRSALVEFVTGQERQGRVRYVSANAEAATRTFAVEIEVDNPDGDIPAGISAEVRLPIEEVAAHFVSPAILSLGDGGALGVKTVGEDMRVDFHRVELVRAQTDGIWITGLPSQAAIISVGQGFVSEGELVKVSESGIDRTPLNPPAMPDVTPDLEAVESEIDAQAEADTDETVVVVADEDPPIETVVEPASGAAPDVAPADAPAPVVRIQEPEVSVETPPDPSVANEGDRDAGSGTVPVEEVDEARTQAIHPIVVEPAPEAALSHSSSPVPAALPRDTAVRPLPSSDPLSFESAQDRVTAVRAVQEELAARGFEPGPVDGLLGPSTRSAIRDFEGAQDLPVTGEVTPSLLSALDIELE